MNPMQDATGGRPPMQQGGQPQPAPQQQGTTGPEMALLQRAVSRINAEQAQYLDQLIDDNPTLGGIIFTMFPGLAALFEQQGPAPGGQAPQPGPMAQPSPATGGGLAAYRSN